MAAVVFSESALRRVIGDDEDGDRRVDGLDDATLLDLYRSLVLLRTYDERSVVYHRQGRIGTYAIFWNHESAIGLLRGMPPATVLQWWRGHPSGWWNPAEWNVASIAVPIASQVPHA